MLNLQLLPTSEPALLVIATERAREYIHHAKAAATVRAYRPDWRHFVAWCVAHGLGSLPAAPETVSLYLAEFGGLLKPATLQRRLAAIAKCLALGRNAACVFHLMKPTQDALEALSKDLSTVAFDPNTDTWNKLIQNVDNAFHEKQARLPKEEWKAQESFYPKSFRTSKPSRMRGGIRLCISECPMTTNKLERCTTEVRDLMVHASARIGRK